MPTDMQNWWNKTSRFAGRLELLKRWYWCETIPTPNGPKTLKAIADGPTWGELPEEVRNRLSGSSGHLSVIEEDKLILTNMLRLADHHRKHCDGASCNISLSFILKLLQRAGISTTLEEASHFM